MCIRDRAQHFQCFDYAIVSIRYGMKKKCTNCKRLYCLTEYESSNVYMDKIRKDCFGF